MKKRLINIIVGICVLCALIGVYFAVSYLSKEETQPLNTDNEETITLAEKNAEDIVNIAYKNTKGDISYTSNNGVWVYDKDAEFPLTQNKLTSFAASLASITAERDITDDGGNEADYGFDEPTLVLKLSYSDGTQNEYTVGSYNQIADGYYLKFNSKIYIVDSTLSDACDKSLFDMLSTTSLLSVTSDSIKGFTINGSEITDTDKVSSLAESYQSIKLGEVENYKDADKYGFDGTEIKITVRYTKKSDVTDESGNVTSSAELDYDYSFSYVKSGDNSYIMLPDDELIYNVSGIDEFNNLIK